MNYGVDIVGSGITESKHTSKVALTVVRKIFILARTKRDKEKILLRGNDGLIGAHCDKSGECASAF